LIEEYYENFEANGSLKQYQKLNAQAAKDNRIRWLNYYLFPTKGFQQLAIHLSKNLVLVTRGQDFSRSKDIDGFGSWAQGAAIFLDQEKDKYDLKGTWGHNFSRSSEERRKKKTQAT
jgi:hypothetical protein